MEWQTQLICFSDGLFGLPSDCLYNLGVQGRKLLSTEKERVEFKCEKGFITTEDGEGVILVPDPPNETESIQLQTLADRNSRDLKHAPPNIRKLTEGKLTEGIIDLLKELMAKRRMDNEVKKYWEWFNAAQTEEEDERVIYFTGRREII